MSPVHPPEVSLNIETNDRILLLEKPQEVCRKVQWMQGTQVNVIGTPNRQSRLVSGNRG